MSAEREEAAPSVDGRAGNRALVLATLAFFLCFAGWGMLAPIAPRLQEQLGLSETETAIMIALPVVLGSLLRIPLGRLADRFGGRVVFTGMLVYAAVPPLLVGTASSYPMLLLAGLLLGVLGASFAIGVPYVSAWFAVGRQGSALGLYGIGTAGTAVSAFAMPALVDGPGRGVAGVIYAAALVAFAVLWLVAARDAPRRVHQRTQFRDVLRLGPSMWQLALFYFVTFGGFVAMSLYLPKLLHDWFDYSLAGAGLRTAGFVVIAAVVARPVGGWLADRLGGYVVLVASFLGVGLDAIALAWQASDPAIVPVTIICLSMAGFLGLGNGAVFKLVPQLFPQATGAVTGIVGAAGGIGGFFPPLALGLVKDATGTYVMAFVFLVAFAWLCAGLAMMLADRERRRARDAPPTPGRRSGPERGRPRVVIAGGGIAALEAVLALDEVAGAKLDVAMLSADSRFQYVPLSVSEAFKGGRAYRLELADMLEQRGVEVVIGRLEAVEAEEHRVRTAEGVVLPYDALLVAVGARRQRALRGALTFAGWKAPEELRRLLRQVGSGRVQRLVFAVPAGVTWTLPAYELALMAAASFEENDVAADVALVTPESRPLEVFGEGPSKAVERMLKSRGVAFHSATPTRVTPGRLVLENGDMVPADAVVALPELVAPEIPGLPCDSLGFLPVDEHCRVHGVEGVYAAGDVTSFLLKQGGIAAQQADAAAEAIAADLGADVTPQPFQPVLRGLLLEGPPQRYRRVEPRASGPVASMTERDVQWPHAKVAGRLLAPFLALQGVPPGAPPGTVALDLAAAIEASAEDGPWGGDDVP